MIASSLQIMLWDKEIGRLSWDARRGVSFFEYNPAFLGGRLDPFPLVASVKSPASRRPIMGDRETKLYRKLPPFLADSLPDAWGNQVFECWRIQNGIRNQEITPLEILFFIGKRGMGALEFIPESSGIRKSEKLNMKLLTDLAQRIFLERENVRLLPDESLTMQSLIAVGTSAGGRQPKAIIAINPKTGEIRSGQIAGHKGFDYCILKFGDAERSSAELEMAYYKMARAAGISMMPCRIIEIEGQTLEDALALGKENGIRKAESIIGEVASAIRQFRHFAEECEVSQRWIGAVETTLNQHLAEWGLLERRKNVAFRIGETLFEKVRVEKTYKGNYHLLCEVDGKERKFVITGKKEEYALIDRVGTDNLTDEQLYSLVETFFVG